MCATRPKKNPSGKWLRFSLRTLLAVMTILCLVFGLVISNARRQKAAVESLVKLGVNVSYEPEYEHADSLSLFGEDPPRRVRLKLWLAEKLGKDFVYEVTSLNNFGKPIAERDLIALRSIPSLTHVNLSGLTLTEAGLQYVGEIDGLVALNLEKSDISVSGFQRLTSLKHLRELDLRWTNVTDKHIADLGKLSNLSALVLPEGITDAGMKNVKSLQNLESLMLWRSKVTDEGLKHIRGLQLNELGLLNMPNITDEGLRVLPENLIGLYLAGCPIGNTGTEIVSELPNLEVLDLSESQVTDRGMEALSKIQTLVTLRLENCDVSEAGLKHITRLPVLRQLMLGGARVTSEDVTSLSSTLKNCDIYEEVVEFWPYWP